MKCKNCFICKKTSCSIYNNINTNNDVDGDSWNHYGKTSFGSNKTKRNGGKRPTNSPKGFFD